MPQGMGLKFLVVGERLLMWMASASYEVEHNGSTMYDTPRILAQLGERDVHVSASSQSNLLTLLIRERVTRLVLSDHTLADSGFNQGGIPSMIQAILDQSGPPRDTKNCDVCHAGGGCVAPVARRFRRCKLVQPERCSRTPTERRTVLCRWRVEELR